MTRQPPTNIMREKAEPGLQLDRWSLAKIPTRDQPYLRFSSLRETASEQFAPIDRPHPPDLKTLERKHALIGHENPQDFGSPKFAQALQGISQLLIFDCFFKKPAMRFLRDCLDPMPHNLTNIFILSGRDAEEETRALFKDILKQGKERQNSLPQDFRLLCELTPDQSPFPHDRFALLDGELWHFGATVGGTYRGMNAFSYGWKDTDVQFSKFFKTAWDSLDRANPGASQ